ncbi:MAG: hypothetical protein BWX70_02897 [Verrucomicrobia bacterium ADurb.Bin070]|nr:MAG: hypothetical protein BWX70_02897 [Verrucomicrobia bacterium ADurb.Bin070]
MSPKPVITARTMMMIATPNTTPMTEISVTTEVNERFGRRYFRARKREKGIQRLPASTVISSESVEVATISSSTCTASLLVVGR